MANRKRERAQNMASRGASAAKIERRTGVSNRAATRIAARYAPTPTPTSSGSTATATTPEIKGVKQGLRIAGAGGISAGELRKFRADAGVSDEKLIKSLDKVNTALKEKGKTGISLNAGALNKIIKRATNKPQQGFGFNTFDFGKGRIGQDIMSRMGDPGSSGYMRQGQLMGARDATEPRFLAGGMQIRPGGRERVMGFGKQYELPERFKPKDEVVDDTTTKVDDTTTSTTTSPEPVIPEPEPTDTPLSNGFGGLDLASWASGYKRARSSRQRAGRRAQGTGQMKTLKFKQQV